MCVYTVNVMYTIDNYFYQSMTEANAYCYIFTAERNGF